MNLVKDQFVPVIQDGKVIETSLMDTILNAHEIDRVHSSDSPLITAGMLRILAAVINRITNFKDESEWQKTFDEGQFSPKLVKKYFKQYENRFELYGPNAFLQNDSIEKWVKKSRDKKPKKVEKTKPEKEKDDSKAAHWLAYLQESNWPFLVHHNEECPMKLSDAELARWLIARQTFSPSEGRDGVTFNYYSPVCDINNGVTFFIMGDNLFETLMFNLYVKFSPTSNWNSPEDIASWEIEKHSEPTKFAVPVKGMSHILSWLTRYIKLQENGTIQCIGGWSCGATSDPNGLYLTNKKGERKSVRAEPYRMWPSIVQLYNNNKTTVDLVWAIHKLREKVSRDFSIFTYYLAMNFKKQKLVNWGESTLVWNKTIADRLAKFSEEDREAFIDRLGQSIDISRTIFNAANSAVLTLQKLDAEEKNKPRKKDKAMKVPLAHLANEYWSFAEQTFWEIIAAATKATDPVEFIDNNLTREGEWGVKLIAFAKKIINKYLEGIIIDPSRIYGPLGVWHTFEMFKFGRKKTSKNEGESDESDESDESESDAE